MYLTYYQKKLKIDKMPYFLKKYLKCPSLIRLKKVGYFCGMDYASKDIYDFGEYVSRYDHSLDVALITYKYTKSKRATIAGLFHDVATPCFSHVIDYMNKDYSTQESTEEYTELIIKNDKYLLKCLKKDKIRIEDIVDFKRYPIVDNNRPKLCADRIDGVILTGLFWTKNITIEDIDAIIEDMVVFSNENKMLELGFKKYDIIKKVVDVSKSIDIVCHSNEDNYMMELLANLTKYVIDNHYIEYDDLYTLNEEYLHQIFNKINDEKFKRDYEEFKNIKISDIPKISLPNVKARDLNPLLLGKRIK
jgi:HD superfamily phosphohydrolase